MQLSEQEQYISVDVEATGPVPGLYSMIDIGMCDVRNLDNCFSTSLVELPNAGWEDGALSFWNRNDHNKRVLTQIQERAQPVEYAIRDMAQWLAQFPNPILVGFPAGFDFAFVHYYWWLVMKRQPRFGHSAFDGKTLAQVVMHSGYREAAKKLLRKKVPQGFSKQLRHTHFAEDDAKEQAFLFNELVKLI